MATKGVVPLGLKWVISLLIVLGLAWLTGFLYWKIRIARALSDIRSEAPALLAADYPPSPLLQEAGSRAIPAVLQELRDAVLRKDRAMANVCYGIFQDTKIHADFTVDGNSALGWDITPKTLRLENLQKIVEGYVQTWNQIKHRYPPWWMWWSGKRFRR